MWKSKTGDGAVGIFGYASAFCLYSLWEMGAVLSSPFGVGEEGAGRHAGGRWHQNSASSDEAAFSSSFLWRSFCSLFCCFRAFLCTQPLWRCAASSGLPRFVLTSTCSLYSADKDFLVPKGAVSCMVGFMF